MNDLIRRKSIRNLYSCLNPNDRVLVGQVLIDIDAIPSAEVPTTMTGVIDAIREAEYSGYKQGKEDEHRWWTKLCADCDGAIDEPQPSKILEAYSKGFKDGADAVKGIKDEPRAEVDCDRCKHKGEYAYCRLCGRLSENNYEPKDEPQTNYVLSKDSEAYKINKRMEVEEEWLNEQSGKE